VPPAADAKAACDAGRGDACFTLATAATPADNDLLGRACNLGEVAACTTLAKALPAGPTATDRWRQACALRDAKACVELGTVLTKSAPAEAAMALRFACSMGDTQACVTASGLEASTPKDNLWDDARSLCDNGDPRACTEYGVAILRTDPLDGLGAIPWLTKACEGGDGAGCRMAGNLHSASAGIGRDLPKALDFLDKGCKLGDVLACERLTWHYGKGIGVAADTAKVAAAEASACAVLGKEGCAADWRAAGPTWVKRAEPEFPSLINPKSIPFGLCRVRVTVSKSGSVSKVDVVDCDARFDANTLEAVKKWKAEPGERVVDVRVIYGAPK
jgi:TonB family protein